jgi:hypothetical protein
LADLDAAKENLRVREGMPNINGIGFVDLSTGTESQTAVQRHQAAVQTIRAWAEAKEYHAIIWTALDSNFSKPAAAGEAFSVEAAVRFMEARPDDERECALNYIRKASSEVQTLVRAAVAARWPQG